MKYTGERIIPDLPDCGPGTLIYATHVARYRFACPLVANKRVLDIACGVGYGSKILTHAGTALVIAGDVSQEAVTYGRSRYRHDRVLFAAMSAQTIPLRPASMDCVVSFETLEHVADAERFADEICRVLRSTGTLVISTPNATTYGRGTEVPDNPFHTREFDLTGFRDLLSGRFASVELWMQRPRVRASTAAVRIDSWARRLLSWDRTGLRRLLAPRWLRQWLRRAADAYDEDCAVRPLDATMDPLFYIAVARRPNKA